MLNRAALICWVVVSSAVLRGQSQLQIDPSSQPAVDQLGSIAHTIKQCPREVNVESHWGKKPTEITRLSLGPPQDVVWDVVPGTSVRAPYSGYVQLTARWTFEILPDGSLDKYIRKNHDFWLLMQKNFVQNPIEYRYEFDVGKNGLELMRSSSRAQCEAVGSITSPCRKPDWQSVTPGFCWGKAAQKGQTVTDKAQR